MNAKGGFSPVKVQNLCLNNFEYNANDIPKEGVKGKDLCKGGMGNNTRQARLQCGLHKDRGSQLWVLGTTEGPEILQEPGAAASYLTGTIVQL